MSKAKKKAKTKAKKKAKVEFSVALESNPIQIWEMMRDEFVMFHGDDDVPDVTHAAVGYADETVGWQFDTVSLLLHRILEEAGGELPLEKLDTALREAIPKQRWNNILREVEGGEPEVGYTPEKKAKREAQWLMHARLAAEKYDLYKAHRLVGLVRAKINEEMAKTRPRCQG